MLPVDRAITVQIRRVKLYYVTRGFADIQLSTHKSEFVIVLDGEVISSNQDVEVWLAEGTVFR